METERTSSPPALGPTGLPFALEASHSDAHSAAVRHPWRAAGHQRPPHVLLFGADRGHEPGTPQNQRNAVAEHGHAFARRRHFPAPGSAAYDAGEFVVVDSGHDAGQPERERP